MSMLCWPSAHGVTLQLFQVCYTIMNLQQWHPSIALEQRRREVATRGSYNLNVIADDVGFLFVDLNPSVILGGNKVNRVMQTENKSSRRMQKVAYS